jgi:hypothetical protein
MNKLKGRIYTMKNYLNRGVVTLAALFTSFSIQASEGEENESSKIDSCVRSTSHYVNQISGAIIENSEKCVERAEKCIEVSEKCVKSIPRIIEIIDKLFGYQKNNS